MMDGVESIYRSHGPHEDEEACFDNAEDQPSKGEGDDNSVDAITQFLVLMGSLQHDESCSMSVSTSILSSSSSLVSDESSTLSLPPRQSIIYADPLNKENDCPLLQCFSAEKLAALKTTNCGDLRSSCKEGNSDDSYKEQLYMEDLETGENTGVLLSLPVLPSSSKVFFPIHSFNPLAVELKFNADNLEEAPVEWLRHFQDVFKKLLKSRIEEWKCLLINHYGDVTDAQKLVTSLNKGTNKLIVACRGHTRVSNITAVDTQPSRLPKEKQMREKVDDGRDEPQSHTSTVVEYTEKGLGSATTSRAGTIMNLGRRNTSATSHNRSCEFTLNLELLVKLRKGHRSFSTSCYTVHLKIPRLVATYNVCPSVHFPKDNDHHYQVGSLSYVKVSWSDKYGGDSGLCDVNGAESVLEAMKHRVEQLALKAVANHAVETPGISQRWKSPIFLNKLWNVQDRAAILAPVSRGFLTSVKKQDHHISDESSIVTFQTSSTLSSIGSRSASVPIVVNTTKNLKRQPVYRSVWFQSFCHALVFCALFLTSLVSLRFHSRLHSSGQHVWKTVINHASSLRTASSTMLSILGHSAVSSQVDSLSSRSNLGVSFSRSINDIPQDETFTFTLSFDDPNHHCQTSDHFGPNNCHYEWNEYVTGSYHVEMPDKFLNESASVEVTAMLDNRVPYKVECPVCGQDCVLEIPVFKIRYTIPMPPCPVSLKNRTEGFEFHLWRMSPTDGWLTVPVSASGVVYEAPGIELASFEMHLTVR